MADQVDQDEAKQRDWRVKQTDRTEEDRDGLLLVVVEGWVETQSGSHSRLLHTINDDVSRR